MNLRIFSGVWGTYMDTFEKGVAASLSWPLNKDAIKDATWTVVTEERYAGRVLEAKKKCGIEKGETIFLHTGSHPTHQLSGHLYNEMKKCIKENATFLFALPDYVFGDGTVPNLKAMMTEPGLCLAVPNTRVLPQIMDHFTKPWPNNKLVGLAFQKEFIHQTWDEAEIGKDLINSFYGGVAWKEIKPGLIAVTHRLPSSYMCQFRESDIEFFKTQHTFSAWDHVWGAKLIEEGRQRFISLSDVGFIVEVTEPDKNQSLTIPVTPDGPTAFHRNLFHNKMNRIVVSYFRKENTT